MNLIGLLFAALIVVFMAFTAMKTYFKAPDQKVAAQLKEVAPEQDFNTSTYRSVLDSVKTNLDASSQQELDRAREIERTP